MKIILALGYDPAVQANFYRRVSSSAVEMLKAQLKALKKEEKNESTEKLKGQIEEVIKKINEQRQKFKEAANKFFDPQKTEKDYVEEAVELISIIDNSTNELVKSYKGVQEKISELNLQNLKERDDFRFARCLFDTDKKVIIFDDSVKNFLDDVGTNLETYSHDFVVVTHGDNESLSIFDKKGIVQSISPQDIKIFLEKQKLYSQKKKMGNSFEFLACDSIYAGFEMVLLLEDFKEVFCYNKKINDEKSLDKKNRVVYCREKMGGVLSLEGDCSVEQKDAFRQFGGKNKTIMQKESYALNFPENLFLCSYGGEGGESMSYTMEQLPILFKHSKQDVFWIVGLDSEKKPKRTQLETKNKLYENELKKLIFSDTPKPLVLDNVPVDLVKEIFISNKHHREKSFTIYKKAFIKYNYIYENFGAFNKKDIKDNNNNFNFNNDELGSLTFFTFRTLHLTVKQDMPLQNAKNFVIKKKI